MLSILSGSGGAGGGQNYYQTSPDEMAWACTLVFRQLCRKLLPLLQRVFREMRERDGGLAAEFERILYWDEAEQARVTHGILLADIPDLIWLIDLILSLKSRRFAIVTSNLFAPLEMPCVFFEPYMFSGDLFKSIVRQWKLSSPPPSKLESKLSHVIDMNTLFQDCLNEWIEQNVPLRAETRKSFSKLEQEHAVLWGDIKLRHYIRHRSEWLKHLKQRHEQEKKDALLPRDLHVWTQSTIVMKAAADEMAKWTLTLNKLRPLLVVGNKKKPTNRHMNDNKKSTIETELIPQKHDNKNKDDDDAVEEEQDEDDDEDVTEDDATVKSEEKKKSPETELKQHHPAPQKKMNRLNWQRKAENALLLTQKTTTV